MFYKEDSKTLYRRKAKKFLSYIEFEQEIKDSKLTSIKFKILDIDNIEKIEDSNGDSIYKKWIKKIDNSNDFLNIEIVRQEENVIEIKIL